MYEKYRKMLSEWHTKSEQIICLLITGDPMTSKIILDILTAVADYEGTINTVTAYLSVVKKAPLWKHVDVTKAPHPNKTLTYTWLGPAEITVAKMYKSVKAGVKKTTADRTAVKKAAAPAPILEDLTGPYAELLQGKASITEKTIALAMSGEDRQSVV